MKRRALYAFVFACKQLILLTFTAGSATPLLTLPPWERRAYYPLSPLSQLLFDIFFQTGDSPSKQKKTQTKSSKTKQPLINIFLIAIENQMPLMPAPQNRRR